MVSTLFFVLQLRGSRLAPPRTCAGPTSQRLPGLASWASFLETSSVVPSPGLEKHHSSGFGRPCRSSISAKPGADHLNLSRWIFFSHLFSTVSLPVWDSLNMPSLATVVIWKSFQVSALYSLWTSNSPLVILNMSPDPSVNSASSRSTNRQLLILCR